MRGQFAQSFSGKFLCSFSMRRPVYLLYLYSNPMLRNTEGNTLCHGQLRHSLKCALASRSTAIYRLSFKRFCRLRLAVGTTPCAMDFGICASPQWAVMRTKWA